MNEMLEVLIDKKNIAIKKDNQKCIQCGYCVRTCKNDITVLKLYDVNKTKKPICIHCGQCANICPTEAIHETFDYLKVKKILKDKKKVIVVSIAPSVRVALGEEFSLLPGINLEGKIVNALKQIGADYVFDISYGADLTIMEEAMEFVKRIQTNKNLPMFTSCCPAWVNYCEIFYPKLLPNLSTCKSPIAMESTIIKTYFAKLKKINPKDIVHIVIAPCTAKKYEITRDELNTSCKYNNIKNLKDTDYLLTTRELAMLLKEEKIDFKKLKSKKFDNPFQESTGSGILFGSSGGVMEAAIRTSYYLLTHKNLRKKDLVFNELRGMKGMKETSLEIDGKVIKFLVCNGIKNAKVIIDKILKKEVYYDFIEVMNCFGGCIAGGGQPKITLLNMNDTKLKRMNGLYLEDENKKIRLSHENKSVISLYQNFLEEPNSKLAFALLHTTYFDKSYLLDEKKEHENE